MPYQSVFGGAHARKKRRLCASFVRRNSTRHFLTSSIKQKGTGTRLNLETPEEEKWRQLKLEHSAISARWLVNITNLLADDWSNYASSCRYRHWSSGAIQQVNQRVTRLDHRVDRLELKLVESFTTKADWRNGAYEEHLIRIENKMDQFIKKCWII